MNHEIPSTPSSESALSQLVEKACQHWDARRQAAAAQRDLPQVFPPFTVALSREVGTQGTTVAQEVGKLLGWPVYDHGLVEKIAQDMGLRTSLLESVDERQQSGLLEMAEAFLSTPRKGDWGPLVTESGYIHHLVKTVLALGVHGECVIVGRGAVFILPAATTVRVRLVGPVRERIAVLSQNLGISEREAAHQVRTMDHERTDFVQDFFQQNPTDPQNYDLVLNASRLSVAPNAELIVETLHRLQARALEKNTVKQSS